jgi:hypothetical protein
LGINTKYKILKGFFITLIILVICIGLFTVYAYKKAYSPMAVKQKINTYGCLLEQELYCEAQNTYGDDYRLYFKINNISILYTEWYNVNPWNWTFVVKYEIPDEVKLYTINDPDTYEITGRMFGEISHLD